jgi:mRNA interferase RelE/StbE
MMGDNRWQVVIHRKAEKTLKQMHGEMLKRTRSAIRSLAENPRPIGYKKMSGYENLYRIRVGEWRIIYVIEDDTLIVLVLEVAPRSGVYRNY